MARRLAAAALTAVVAAACGRTKAETYRDANALTHGDAAHGATLIRGYGCGTCHNIAGIPGAVGTVGPPLNGVAGRAYIAGVLPNTPENMVDWIYNPPAADPQTAMPNLGMSRQEARDIAAYVYTLK